MLWSRTVATATAAAAGALLSYSIAIGFYLPVVPSPPLACPACKTCPACTTCPTCPTCTSPPPVDETSDAATVAPPAVPKPCCYPGVRCVQNQTKRYNIFVISCLPESMIINSVKVFQPMWETVYRGLQSRDRECGYRVFPMLAYHADQNFRFPMDPTAGDVVILVGHERWSEFMDRCKKVFAPQQVYCIWYYSEHEHVKAYFKFEGLCEVWEYTRANVPDANLVRYIAPGFLPTELTIADHDRMVLQTVEANRKLSYTSDNGLGLTLHFVGHVLDSREACWQHLKTVKFFSKFSNGNVWGLEGWRKFAKQPGVISVNMHRFCNDSSQYQVAPRPLETVRMSSLLTAGAIVISEETNPGDAAAYDGIVLVEPNLFKNSSWSDKLQKILTDPQALAAWQLSAYNRFKAKFSPQQVLMDEDVWDGGFMARGGCTS